MPVKLIGTIILLILVTIFAGINIDNKCIIDFGFYKTPELPVFITVIASFVLGLIVMFPFTLGRKKSKKCPKNPDKADMTGKETPKQAPATESKTLFDFKIKREAKSGESKKEKKTLFGAKKKTGKPDTSSKDSSKPENANSADAESTGAPV